MDPSLSRMVSTSMHSFLALTYGYSTHPPWCASEHRQIPHPPVHPQPIHPGAVRVRTPPDPAPIPIELEESAQTVSRYASHGSSSWKQHAHMHEAAAKAVARSAAQCLDPARVRMSCARSHALCCSCGVSGTSGQRSAMRAGRRFDRPFLFVSSFCLFFLFLIFGGGLLYSETRGARES